MSGSRFVVKVKNLVSQHPFLVLETLLSKLPGRPIGLTLFYLLHLPEAPAKAMRDFGSVRAGTVEDIPGMCGLENKEQLFLQRFNGGDSCAVAVRDGSIVGYIWYSDKPFHQEGCTNYLLNIRADTIYSYDCLITPEYRLRGIWVLFQKHMLEAAQARGRKGLVSLVAFGNDPSLKAHLRYGFVITRRILCVRFLSWTYFREKNFRPSASSKAAVS